MHFLVKLSAEYLIFGWTWPFRYQNLSFCRFFRNFPCLMWLFYKGSEYRRGWWGACSACTCEDFRRMCISKRATNHLWHGTSQKPHVGIYWNPQSRRYKLFNKKKVYLKRERGALGSLKIVWYATYTSVVL